jgi:hypothetical protein
MAVKYLFEAPNTNRVDPANTACWSEGSLPIHGDTVLYRSKLPVGVNFTALQHIHLARFINLQDYSGGAGGESATATTPNPTYFVVQSDQIVINSGKWWIDTGAVGSSSGGNNTVELLGGTLKLKRGSELVRAFGGKLILDDGMYEEVTIAGAVMETVRRTSTDSADFPSISVINGESGIITLADATITLMYANNAEITNLDATILETHKFGPNSLRWDSDKTAGLFELHSGILDCRNDPREKTFEILKTHRGTHAYLNNGVGNISVEALVEDGVIYKDYGVAYPSE